ATCLGLTDDLCESDCAAHAQATERACHGVATAEQQCLLELSCEEAKAYATQGRRDHARCGEHARAYFEACTVGGGTIPDACQALCASYAACDALDVAVGACEERCTLQATAYQASRAACGDAFQAFAACAANADCGEVSELADSQLSPVACENALQAMQAACE